MSSITPNEASIENERVCKLAPVIPVLVIEDASKAKNLGEALVEGGLPALEVTLRTPAALDAISEMASVQGGVVGAGTLLNEDDVKNAIAAGAKFGVSPGATDDLLDACEKHGLPLLAGVNTPSEVMRMLERGYTVAKFFPAEAAGGAKFLGSLASPLPQMRFCPTGGVSTKNAPDYLAQSNILCVGGSWVAPKDALLNDDWDAIRNLAQSAASLG